QSCTAQCSGDQVCSNNACTNAFPMTYAVTIENITFAQHDPNGQCWDEPGCGAPDPKIEIRQDGVLVGEIDQDDDTYQATYNKTFDLFFNRSAKLEIKLLDQDLGNDDPAVVCEFDALSAQNIRNGDLRRD